MLVTLKEQKPVYIFLDIDGVLNNIKHYRKQHEKYGGRFFCQNMPFNPKSIENLRKVVKRFDAKIVLTSSWRKSAPCMTVLEARLCEYGLKIYDKTGDVGSRCNEIVDWMFAHTKDDEAYIIIDDEMYDILEGFNRDHIVEVNSYKGFNRAKMQEAIDKIERQMK